MIPADQRPDIYGFIEKEYKGDFNKFVDDLINGIIRSRFTQTEEDAIKTHQLLRLTNPEHPLAAQYADEFNLFNIEREYAISTVDSWLAQ